MRRRLSPVKSSKPEDKLTLLPLLKKCVAVYNLKKMGSDVDELMVLALEQYMT